jgi:hypothetical protein
MWNGFAAPRALPAVRENGGWEGEFDEMIMGSSVSPGLVLPSLLSGVVKHPARVKNAVKAIAFLMVAPLVTLA